MSDKVSLSDLGQQSQPVPSDAIALPSEGKLYPPGHPLHGAKAIEIRPMTARDEDIMTSRVLFKSGKAIDTLLRSCILDKSINVGQMLVGDRNAAIIGIRVSGYGREYNSRLECPQCGERSEISVDLGNLPIKSMPEGVEPVIPFTNEFLFELPVSKRKVTFKLPTGDDEAELGLIIERSRKHTGTENLVTNRLALQIISIDGDTTKSKIVSAINSLPARDSRELRAYMDSLTPDVRLVQNFICPVCTYEAEEVDVPLGTEFFWPSSRR